MTERHSAGRGQNCRDCYKCIRNCLLKAIRYSDGRAQIIREDVHSSAANAS